MSICVDVRHVTVRAAGRTRLDDVSLTVAEGEIHALIGPNGSGKSTLLAVIAGDLSPASGDILIMGTPIAELSARAAAQRRALLAQETTLAFPFTVADVVSWGRLPWRGTPRQSDDARVIEQVLFDQGISELRDRAVTSLSGGERARVHLARVLAQEAPLVLLDEADATLDLAGQAHLDDAIRTCRDAGSTIVIVGHDLGRLSALADSATLLAHGRVVSQGTVSDTLTVEALSAAYGMPVATRSLDGRRIYWAN